MISSVYFRLRSTRYRTTAMMTTIAMTSTIASSLLITDSSDSISPLAVAAGPTVTQVVAQELPMIRRLQMKQ